MKRMSIKQLNEAIEKFLEDEEEISFDDVTWEPEDGVEYTADKYQKKIFW